MTIEELREKFKNSIKNMNEKAKNHSENQNNSSISKADFVNKLEELLNSAKTNHTITNK